MKSKDILKALQSKSISIEDAKLKLMSELEESNVEYIDSNTNLVNDIKGGHEENNIEKIAIIGMSGRYPDAENLNEYWQNILDGKNSIKEIPKWRWNVEEYYDDCEYKQGKINCKWLGVLDNIKCFDPLFFNISPLDAELMDPQQRIFLQEAYKAFEDSGYSTRELSKSKCGVYLGIMDDEYNILVHDNKMDGNDILGDSMAIASARISYFLNLKGPAITLDTACSSSLVAMHIACNQLRNKEIDMALVGGVSLYLRAESYIGMCNSGMLSTDGQCKTFDNDANGFVPGEGVGALVVKRLSDAERDNDHIYGVILASGLNQDGKTNGITAPSSKSQYGLIKNLYENNNINPESINYVEMHGTGTKLGDPIELQAITNVFQEKTKKNKFCAIGSVKSNIGHTSAAAGIASIQKVLLCLKNNKLVPTLNYNTPNEHYDFENSPFYVNTKVREWKNSNLRRAAISAFGFSGTNAHLVIEEYKSFKVNKSENFRNSLFLLSAKSEEQLIIYADNMKNYIEKNDFKLGDICYTSQVGREAMSCRVAIVTSSKLDLVKKLSDFTKNVNKKNYITGIVTEDMDDEIKFNIRSIVNSRGGISEDNLKMLGQNWVEGKDINWNELYIDNKPYKISLPTYPFNKEEYWVCDNKKDKDDIKELNKGQRLYPLIHENLSNFFMQKFRITFTGKELFLQHHKVNGKKVLPASAYIEMVIEAIQASFPKDVLEELFLDGKGIEFTNVIWNKGIIIENSLEKVYLKLELRDKSNVDYEIYKDGEDIANLKGEARIINYYTEKQAVDINSLLNRKENNLVKGESIYSLFNEIGIDYGEAHKGIKEVYIEENRALCKVIAPSIISKEINGFVLEPSLFDATLQGIIALNMQQKKDEVFLPYMIKRMKVLRKLTEKLYVVVREENKERNDIRTFYIDIYNNQGLICVSVEGLITKNLNTEKKNEASIELDNYDNFLQNIINSIDSGNMSEEDFERVIKSKVKELIK